MFTTHCQPESWRVAGVSNTELLGDISSCLYSLGRPCTPPRRCSLIISNEDDDEPETICCGGIQEWQNSSLYAECVKHYSLQQASQSYNVTQTSTAAEQKCSSVLDHMSHSQITVVPRIKSGTKYAHVCGLEEGRDRRMRSLIPSC